METKKINHYDLVGKYYGFPECCIVEFKTGKPKSKSKVFAGTGYIPCQKCVEHFSKEELISKINENRVCPVDFPLTNNENSYEKYFYMFLSEKHKCEWFYNLRK